MNKNREFISESIAPVAGTADTGTMAAGVPGLPRAFTWRGETLTVAEVRCTWRETGPCTHGSGEMYLRKHWFEVRTDTGKTALIYFERRPCGANKKTRWWLFTLENDSHKKP